MIVYTLLFLTVIIAILSLYILWGAATKEVKYSWYRFFSSFLLATVIYLYGAWVFLSVYSKYVFGITFAAVMIISLCRKKNKQVTKLKLPGILASLFFSLIFCVLIVLYYVGTAGKPFATVNLTFPFKMGKYLVFQGGKGLPTNLFHYGLRGAVFAMDIVRLNDAGNRAKHIFSTRLEDYEIYGDTLYSPCSGFVLKAKDDNPDNIPPNRKRGPSNTNQVLIETTSFYVFMGHLKQGCVFVHEGDTVRAGQPLGCIGNSGFSLEPHLHIQAHAKTDKNIPWYKEKPLLIAFDGKSYLLFEEIKPKEK